MNMCSNGTPLTLMTWHLQIQYRSKFFIGNRFHDFQEGPINYENIFHGKNPQKTKMVGVTSLLGSARGARGAGRVLINER